MVTASQAVVAAFTVGVVGVAIGVGLGLCCRPARRDPIDRLIEDVLGETRDHQWLRDGQRPEERDR